MGAQKEAETRALQSDVDRQADLVAKLKAENDRIRYELGHSAAKSDVSPGGYHPSYSTYICTARVLRWQHALLVIVRHEHAH